MQKILPLPSVVPALKTRKVDFNTAALKELQTERCYIFDAL